MGDGDDKLMLASSPSATPPKYKERKVAKKGYNLPPRCVAVGPDLRPYIVAGWAPQLGLPGRRNQLDLAGRRRASSTAREKRDPVARYVAWEQQRRWFRLLCA